MNLYDVYKRIYDNSELWDYYNGGRDFSFDDILCNPKKFIKGNLDLGEKLPSEAGNNFDKFITLFRAKHTISMYFTGIYIYNNCENIKLYIDTYLNEVRIEMLAKSKIPTEKWNPASFEYYWLLICFFHDFACEASKFKDYGFYKLFNQGSVKGVQIAVNRQLDKLPQNINTIPNVLQKNCSSYSYFRQDGKDEKIDHGIMGGTYYYYDRKKQLEKQLGRTDVTKYAQDEVYDSEKNLVWSRYLLDFIHADVSWIIAAHNMWFKKIDDTNKSKYEDEGLKDLIINNPVYQVKDYPLFFLLSFVDAFDIFKFLANDDEDFDLIDGFKNIQYESDENSLTIKLRGLFKKKTFEYLKKICEEEYRLPILTDYKDDKIIITFS